MFGTGIGVWSVCVCVYRLLPLLAPQIRTRLEWVTLRVPVWCVHCACSCPSSHRVCNAEQPDKMLSLSLSGKTPASARASSWSEVVSHFNTYASLWLVCLWQTRKKQPVVLLVFISTIRTAILYVCVCGGHQTFILPLPTRPINV